MILLSIIVPTYNMEKYLARCLNSVIVGNESRHDFEILVVNDGSKDHSLKIAEQFKDKYPNIIRVIDKPNGNYGSCINCGLKKAVGKYFRILDADDTFSNVALSDFLDKLSHSNEDMIISNFIYKYDLTKQHNRIAPQGITFDKTYHSFDFSVDNYEVLSMHAVTYKTSLLADIQLYLDEGVSYTDLEYVYFPLKYIKSLKFINCDLYEYHIGREGQTVNPINQVKSYKSLLVVSKRLVDDFASDYNKSNSVLRNNQKVAINKIIYATFKIGLVYCEKNKENNEILKTIYKKLKETDISTLWLKKKKIKPLVCIWSVTGIYFNFLNGKFNHILGKA